MTDTDHDASSAPASRQASGEVFAPRELRKSRRQIELYTLASIDVLVVMFSGVLVFGVWARSDAWDICEVLASLVTVAFAVACLLLLHRTPAGRAPSRGWLVTVMLLTLGSTAALSATLDPSDVYLEGLGLYMGLLFPLYLAVTVVSLFMPWRRLLPVSLVGAVAVTAVFAAFGLDPSGVAVLGVYAVLAALLGLATGALTFWMLDVIRQLDEARSASAQLAVAEERLRFSRDLHDVYGRTLSAIAMKSELAAELALRGDERGVAEMRAVRALAQESLAEVRGIVAGYREISLEAEVAGAAATLRSAGARFEVHGLDEVLPLLRPEQRTVLAWTVREAVTNVIRHSHAHLVTLRAARTAGTAGTDGAVTVTITNDGVAKADSRDAADGVASGNGLRGLGERAAGIGGTIASRHEGTSFALVLTLPTKEHHP